MRTKLSTHTQHGNYRDTRSYRFDSQRDLRGWNATFWVFSQEARESPRRAAPTTSKFIFHDITEWNFVYFFVELIICLRFSLTVTKELFVSSERQRRRRLTLKAFVSSSGISFRVHFDSIWSNHWAHNLFTTEFSSMQTHETFPVWFCHAMKCLSSRSPTVVVSQ